MKRKIKNILSAVTIGACVAANMTSCESYLDVDSYFYDQNTIDSVFQSKVLVNEYLMVLPLIFLMRAGFLQSLLSRLDWLLMSVLLLGKTVAMPVCILCWVMKRRRVSILIIGHIITKESEKRIFYFQELVSVKICLIWNGEIIRAVDIS